MWCEGTCWSSEGKFFLIFLTERKTKRRRTRRTRRTRTRKTRKNPSPYSALLPKLKSLTCAFALRTPLSGFIVLVWCCGCGCGVGWGMLVLLFWTPPLFEGSIFFLCFRLFFFFVVVVSLLCVKSTNYFLIYPLPPPPSNGFYLILVLRAAVN